MRAPRQTHRSIRYSMAAITALVAMVATSCATNPPAAGNTFRFQATKIVNIAQVGDCGCSFWDLDGAEEPYLVHLALRANLTASPPVVTTFVTSNYENNGEWIETMSPQEVFNINTPNGPVFTGVQLPDITDLNNGSRLELLGSVELLLERDQLFPIGIVGILQGVTELINAALPPILANGGIPSTPEGILELLGAILPGAVATIVGIVGSIIGQIAGSDELIGVSPQFFLAVGGGLGSFLGASLPSIIDLINFALTLQDPNPFPNGLPVTIGVVGGSSYAEFTDFPGRKYGVYYGWQQLN